MDSKSIKKHLSKKSLCLFPNKEIYDIFQPQRLKPTSHKGFITINVICKFFSSFSTLFFCLSMLNIIIGIKRKIIGGIPINETHLPPNVLRIGRLSLSAIKYILGTITRVRKKATVSPKIIVQDKGPQNATLSPPKRCAA